MLRLSSAVLNSVLNKFGYEIKRLNHSNKLLNLCDDNVHPIEAYYFSKGCPFLLNVPIEYIFNLDFSGIDLNNPYTSTILAYSTGLCTSYHDSPLKDFYQRWQPAEYGVYDKNNKELAPPWDYGIKKTSNLAAARLKRRDFIKVKKELNIDSTSIFGHINHGPVSDSFGEVTYNRFIKLYNSIKANGYKPVENKVNHITASAFINENSYRVTISSGKHRVTALQALGFKTIPIQFGPPKYPVLVRRVDVMNWPNVKNGNYSVDQALSIFDKRFIDKHPSGWVLDPKWKP